MAKPRAKITTQDIDENDTQTVSETATDEIIRDDIAVVTGEGMQSKDVQEYVKDMAFMNQKVTFMIGETTDPNAVNPVQAGINGTIRSFMRGVEYTEKRCFLDALIVRENTVSTNQYRDIEGIDQTRIDKKPVLRFPISIINDPAGATGARWFKFAANNN